MIELESLEWSNWFSYGDNNKIQFNDTKLTQILGSNGSGKSSILMVLQEVLYGKNIKGVRKQDLPNRHTDSASTKATLFFKVESDLYNIILKRTSSINLKLFKNNVDISSHKALDTYKTIQGILGLDFKTFCQLVYQSSTSSLQFLTSTDTQRKRFLISLLSLDKYIEYYEQFKDLSKEETKQLNQLQGSLKTIDSWLDNNSAHGLVKLDNLEVPKEPVDDSIRLQTLNSKLCNIVNINNKINKNNQYKKSLEGLDKEAINNPVPKPDSLAEIKIEDAQIKAKLSNANNAINKAHGLGDKCPTCKQVVSTEWKQSYVDFIQAKIAKLETRNNEVCFLLQQGRKESQVYINQQSIIKEFELLTNYIDNTLESNVLNAKDLEVEISILKNSLNETKLGIQKTTLYNKKVQDNNLKLAVIKEQGETYKKDKNNIVQEIEDSLSLSTNLEILKKSFSTSGLVGFKIESLIKGLEQEINVYLIELSQGRFQLHFVLKGEKLNIDIIDNGRSVSIDALSDGELARVNVATLLAIRKLMSAISNTKINLLFLDEVYGVLDLEGKDTLSELLLKEDLNTFLVAHDYSHPLMNTINIIKENKISRIE